MHLSRSHGKAENPNDRFTLPMRLVTTDTIKGATIKGATIKGATIKDATIMNTTAGMSPNNPVVITTTALNTHTNATPKTIGTEVDSTTKTANAITGTNADLTTTNAVD